MERVAFLIEETNERLGCLLNPEGLVMRRAAGVQPRRSVAGQLTGLGLADDPLLYTGGGRTELELDLLFDVSLAGSSISSDDVRDLTAPLWNLAENAARPDSYGRPPLVRFIWGKSWNLLSIVVAVAERLERFTPAGAPQRSWLRLRLLRVTAPPARTLTARHPAPAISSTLEGSEASESRVRVHQLIGGEPAEASGLATPAAPSGPGERLDQLAARYYGDPAVWRLLAAYNNIDDPLHVPAGQLLRIPPASA
jgi:hypothetical protein